MMDVAKVTETHIALSHLNMSHSSIKSLYLLGLLLLSFYSLIYSVLFCSPLTVYRKVRFILAVIRVVSCSVCVCERDRE